MSGEKFVCICGHPSVDHARPGACQGRPFDHCDKCSCKHFQYAIQYATSPPHQRARDVR